MSINRASISGNLTRDAELRTTQGGTQVLGFGVAVNERRKNPQSGEWEDYANFVNCVMFGKRAGSLAQYLTKGTKVAVDGRLHYSSWEKDGQKRSKLEIVVDEIDLMSRREAAQGAQQPQTTSYPQQQQYAPQMQPQQPTQAYQGYQQQMGGMPQQQQPTYDMYEQVYG